jgi:hypothetical protein
VSAFGSGDQLNHFFRTAEPILYVVSVSAQSFCGQLSSDPSLGEARIFGDKPNLVDADSRIVLFPEMTLQAFCQGTSLWSAGLHERPHQIGEFFALHIWVETDAGDSGVVQEIGKAAFGKRGFEGYAIEEKLGTSGTKQQTRATSSPNCLTKFIPGNFKLASRPCVF